MALYQGDKLLGGITVNVEGRSAFEDAKASGYQGTEAEFNAFLANAEDEMDEMNAAIEYKTSAANIFVTATVS